MHITWIVVWYYCDMWDNVCVVFTEWYWVELKLKLECWVQQLCRHIDGKWVLMCKVIILLWLEDYSHATYPKQFNISETMCHLFQYLKSKMYLSLYLSYNLPILSRKCIISIFTIFLSVLYLHITNLVSIYWSIYYIYLSIYLYLSVSI